MCPENANIFIAEDNRNFHESLKDYLRFGGHKVVASAYTYEEALPIIEHLEELGVQVAIVDGNLGSGSWNGVKISEAIRIHNPAVKIIHNSTNYFDGPCDADFRKGDNPDLGSDISAVVKNL